MTRYITVYALNNKEDIYKAAKELESIKPLLPNGMPMRVFGAGSSDETDIGIPSSVFGELVMLVDFDGNMFTYEDFRQSEAWSELKRRTKGLFSNEVTTSYYYE
jgi:hypothetical protein